MTKLFKFILLSLITMPIAGLKAKPLDINWRVDPQSIDDNLANSNKVFPCELASNSEQNKCLLPEIGKASLVSEEIFLKKSMQSYAFYIARYSGSLRVTIEELDTKRVLAQKSTGHFTGNSKTEGIGPIYFEFTIPKDSQIRIIIEYSNALHYKGGIWTRPKLALSSAVIRPILANSLLEFTSLGILLSASIYNFMLWLRRRQEKAALILSLTAFCTAVRLASMSGLSAWLIEDASFLVLVKRIEYMTVPLLVGYGYYYHLAFDSSKKIGRFIYYVWLSALVNVSFIAFASLSWFERWVIISQLQILSAVGVALMVAWNSLRNRSDGAIANFIGCVLILFAALWDITIDRGINATSLFLVPLAGAIYAILQSEILATRNATNHLKVSSLSLRNTEQQVELRVETENRLKLASSVAHHINNPLNYMQFARQSILEATKSIEETIQALLGPYDPQESSELSKCRDSFETDFKKIYSPLETLDRGLVNVSEIVKEIRHLSGIDGLEIREFDFHKLALDAKNSLELSTPANELARIYLVEGEPVYTIGSPQILKHALASIFQQLLKIVDFDLSFHFYKEMEHVICKVSPAFELDDAQRQEISEELALHSKKAKAEIKLIHNQNQLAIEYRFSREYDKLSA